MQNETGGGLQSYTLITALLLLGQGFGTASQYTCMTKTLHITVFGVNSKRFGFNLASGAQCNILINDG